MIVLKLGFIVGLVLASPVILWQLWAFLAPALYEREKRALVPSLFVGLCFFSPAPCCISLRRAPGAPGAVQLPERGDLAVHHLRRLVRLRPPGGPGAGHLLRAAAGDDHPLLARRGRAGRAAPLPPLRRGLRVHRGRGALARGRPALHADDDGSAAVPVRGGCGGRGDRAPPAGRPRRSRRSFPRARPRRGRRRRRRSRCAAPDNGGPRRPHRADGTGGDVDRDPAGPVARQRHRPPPRPAHRPVTELRPAGLGGAGAARTAGATVPLATGPIRRSSSSRTRRSACRARRSRSARGRWSKRTRSPTARTAASSTPREAPTCSTTGRCWLGRGSATTPAAAAA